MDNETIAVEKFVKLAQSIYESDSTHEGLLPGVERKAFDAQQAIAIAKAVCAVMTPVCKMLNDNTFTAERVQEAIDRLGKSDESSEVE